MSLKEAINKIKHPHVPLAVTEEQLMRTLWYLIPHEHLMYFKCRYGIGGYRECTAEEIAEVAGVSVAKVKANLASTVRCLKKHYKRPPGKRLLFENNLNRILQLTFLQRHTEKQLLLKLTYLYAHRGIEEERNIMLFRLHYNLGFGRSYTIAEIAECFNLSQREVVKIIRGILTTLERGY